MGVFALLMSVFALLSRVSALLSRDREGAVLCSSPPTAPSRSRLFRLAFRGRN
jgi:hypothetical protein